MPKTTDQQIDDFFNEVEKEIVEFQAQIAKDSLDALFRNSPHAESSKGRQSKGEYDANHKVQIGSKGMSAHHPPTGSEAVSAMMIEAEKVKAGTVEPEEDIKIINTTPHAEDVETGEPWKVTKGYCVYEKLETLIQTEQLPCLLTR